MYIYIYIYICIYIYTHTYLYVLKLSPASKNISRHRVCLLICPGIHQNPSATVRIMGWLRLVGSIKLLVSFAKEPYERDAILQKRPILLSILLTVATP